MGMHPEIGGNNAASDLGISTFCFFSWWAICR